MQVIPTVFIAISFLFFLFFVLPGDPATLIAGGMERTPNPEVVARANERYGFNDPLWRQFVAYWGRVLRWDLGESFINGQSVNSILYEKAPRSIRLAIWATIIEITVGISVGLIAAVRRYSLTDKATTLATTAAAAIPVFVLGFILQYVFAVLPERYGLTGLDAAADVAPRPGLVVPVLHPDRRAVALPHPARRSRWPASRRPCAARMMRGSMLDVLNADYIRTARSKGLSESTVVLRHGLRNALIPVVTLIGIDFGMVIGAAVLTETVFSWPGIGSQIVDSVNRRDLPVILGLSLGRGDHLLDRQPLGRPVVCLVRPAHPPRGASRVMRTFWRRYSRNKTGPRSGWSSSSSSCSPPCSPISSPPTATASRPATLPRRSVEAITGSAPTTSDATCSRGSSTARASR